MPSCGASLALGGGVQPFLAASHALAHAVGLAQSLRDLRGLLQPGVGLGHAVLDGLGDVLVDLVRGEAGRAHLHPVPALLGQGRVLLLPVLGVLQDAVREAVDEDLGGPHKLEVVHVHAGALGDVEEPPQHPVVRTILRAPEAGVRPPLAGLVGRGPQAPQPAVASRQLEGGRERPEVALVCVARVPGAVRVGGDEPADAGEFRRRAQGTGRDLRLQLAGPGLHGLELCSPLLNVVQQRQLAPHHEQRAARQHRGGVPGAAELGGGLRPLRELHL
mmetsp:Transcript_52946/g.169564  ORF Transcript_52946/g.169564 Transcript_52946/m.169564 type:complete len:275 (-) Transcript_52946:97-921(-)